jgi:hypothetical protein
MKHLKQLVVLAAFAVLACTGLHAQNIDMRAAIPFDFHAGDKLMPAGEYVIHEQGPWVIFNRADGKAAGALLTIATGGRGPAHAQDARVEFNRYGDEYFLSSVWNSFTTDGRQAPPSTRQKELAKRGNGPVPAAVALTSTK